jgi:hypothetical protein
MEERTMQEYDVILREYHEGRWLDEIVFECSADDHAHAQEQAENAYPDCIVMRVDLYEQ